MSDVPLHRLYLHFSELPQSMRVLYTATLVVLGMGYLFALIYIFYSYAGKDGNPKTLSYNDVVIAYSGTGKTSRLESALRGPMSAMLPQDETANIITWLREGADRENYDARIKSIVQARCLTCHDGSNPHLPNLSNYDFIKKLAGTDTGTPVFTLVRVSHIHLFGLTFVFFVVGTIFSHAYVRPVWFKCTVVALPFVALVLDVSSWYFTKLYHPFGYLVIVGGGFMGLCFAYMWVVSVYQMWFSGAPHPVIQRGAGTTRIVG